MHCKLILNDYKNNKHYCVFEFSLIFIIASMLEMGKIIQIDTEILQFIFA